MELVDGLSNAILFTGSKSVAGGLIKVVIRPDGMTEFTGTDDYVLIKSVVKTPEYGKSWLSYYITLDTAKELKKSLEVSPDFSEPNWSFLDNGDLFPTVDEEEVNLFVWEQAYDMLFFDDFFSTGYSQEFAVAPARLRKFSQIKTGGDYPLDFWPTKWQQSTDTLCFKAGPSVSGVLVALDREVLANKFKNEEGVLWG